jgi:hypothetical protein
MTTTPPQRVTSNRPLTLFLIGLRIQRWARPDAWMPAVAAMPPMLNELYADPDSGFLGHRMTLAAGGPLVVQYWRSTADVMRYAHDDRSRHRPAWRAFNHHARKYPGAVGLWHEIYDVAAGSARATYVTMPVAGLDKALSSASASAGDQAEPHLTADDATPRLDTSSAVPQRHLTTWSPS